MQAAGWSRHWTRSSVACARFERPGPGRRRRLRPRVPAALAGRPRRLGRRGRAGRGRPGRAHSSRRRVGSPDAEALDVTVRAGDAFRPGRRRDAARPHRRHLRGLLHHLPADRLTAFFAAQHGWGWRPSRTGTRAGALAGRRLGLPPGPDARADQPARRRALGPARPPRRGAPRRRPRRCAVVRRGLGGRARVAGLVVDAVAASPVTAGSWGRWSSSRLRRRLQRLPVSAGRTGLVDHRAEVVAPSSAASPWWSCCCCRRRPSRRRRSAWRAGGAMLVVYLPYGGLVLSALVVYVTSAGGGVSSRRR